MGDDGRAPAPVARWWIPGASAIVVLAAWALWRYGLNHDIAWYVYMVEAWLGGARPYVDLIDTNPPLILLLTMPPVWAARWLGVDGLLATYIYTFGLALFAWSAAARLLARTLPGASAERRALINLTILFLLTAFPKNDFGQREHFAVMATLPYVLLAAARAVGEPVGRSEAVLAGIVGGCGFALKPHFLIALATVELSVAILQRSPRTLLHLQSLAASATIASYAIVVATGFPEYLDVAERVRQVYGGTNSPAVRLLTLRELQLGVGMLILVGLIRLPAREHAPQVVVAAAATGFLAASMVQMKGWSYHLLPAHVFLVLFFVLFVTGLLAAVPALTTAIRGGSIGAAAALMVGLLGMSAKYVYEAGHRSRLDLVTPMARVVREHAPGGVIAVLGMRTFLYPAFPLVNQTGAQWGLRHNGLWFLAGFYTRELLGDTVPVPYRAPAAMSAMERRFFEEVVSDLDRTPPDLLMVEIAANHAPAGRRALDLVGYYGQDSRFARLFEEYTLIATVPPFEIYRRQQPGGVQRR